MSNPTLSVFLDEYFMRKAYEQAQLAYEGGEVPVGAVVVWQNRIIAKAHNQTELLNDVTAHAEILAISAATQAIGSKYLQDCTLYVTLEPCVMCAGALAWAQLGQLIYGASEEKRGFQQYEKKILHPKTTIIKGVLEKECSDLILDFFRKKR